MSQQLKKEITLLSGIGQLSTTLMGTGLFMIPAISAGIAGEMTSWAWLFLFIAVCPVALTFAALGKHYPNAGGTAHFVRIAFNKPQLGNAVTWLFLSVIPVGVPAAILLAGGFLQQLLPAPLNTSIYAQILTLCLLVVINLSGAKASGQLQTLIALSIFALVIALLWCSDITTADLVMPPLNITSVKPIAMALGVMFWCFVGIEAFAHMGEEFKNPGRDFPLSILAGCLIAGMAYWACSVVVIKWGAYGSPELENTAIPWLSQKLFGGQMTSVINLVGFFACFASINLYLQSLSRMLWSHARHYHPHHMLTRLSSRGIPANATLLIAGIILISILLEAFTHLDLSSFIKLANGVFIMIYLLAMISAWKLLTGIYKGLAGISLLLCSLVFLCLGWAVCYALIIFIAIAIPKRKQAPTSKPPLA
ncbi:L-methionine/branched-chain amino acid transporter [Vibrio quintilis]|nr:L-methionine/branched-chain amino acid transporter [Vibrio quintilis]